MNKTNTELSLLRHRIEECYQQFTLNTQENAVNIRALHFQTQKNRSLFSKNNVFKCPPAHHSLYALGKSSANIVSLSVAEFPQEFVEYLPELDDLSLELRVVL